MNRILLLLIGATLYMTLSGSDCASTQMSSAQLALQNKDYTKAESSFKEEVAVRPGNSKAWYLLASEVYLPQHRYPEMNDAFAKALSATTPPLDEAQVRNVAFFMLDPWLKAYNGANAANSSKNYAKALLLIDTAIQVRPEMAQNYTQKAAILASSGASGEILDAYRSYISIAGPDIKKGIEKGLMLTMAEKEVKAKLGEPTRASVADNNGQFAATYPGELYIYYGPTETGSGNHVIGWKFFTDKTLPEEFKAFVRTLTGFPYYRLGVEAYGQGSKNAKKYDEALEMLQLVEQFDPQQPDVPNLIAQVYIDANRIEEARTMLQKRMKEDPKNPKVYINYSNLLYNSKDYQGATQMLKKVTELGLADNNPSYHTALFNLGAYYKNWGKELQDSVRTATKDRPTAAQQDIYTSKLRESLAYFERLRSIQDEKIDYGLLVELGNLYYALAEDMKLQKLVKDFAALQATRNLEKDGAYWRELSKLYLAIGDETKSKEASTKANALGY